MKLYNLVWRDGYTNRIEGDTIEEAFKQSGYSSGALRALDYYEEIKELPFEEKHLEYINEKGIVSKIVNPEFIKQIKDQPLEVGNEVNILFANRLFTYTLQEIRKYSFLFSKQVMTIK